MRRALFLVPILAMTTVCAGCSENSTEDGRVAVTVFLENDLAVDGRNAVEREIRSVPNAQSVRFESKEQAYTKFKEMYKGSQDLADSTNPNAMPESFQFTLPGNAFAEAATAAMYAIPGVDNVVISAASFDDGTATKTTGNGKDKKGKDKKGKDKKGKEKKSKKNKKKTAAAIVVYLDNDVWEGEKESIEKKVHAIRLAKKVRYESREAAQKRLHKACGNNHRLANMIKPENVHASFRFRVEVADDYDPRRDSASQDLNSLRTAEGVDTLNILPASMA